MDFTKLEKLKVVELKAELQARNLDTKGVKAVLIERLKDALEKGTPLLDGATSEFAASEPAPEVVSTPQKKARRRSTRSQTRSPSPTKKPTIEQEPALEPLPEEESEPTPAVVEEEAPPAVEEAKEEAVVEPIQKDVAPEEETPAPEVEEKEPESEKPSEESEDAEMKEVDNQENGDNENKEQPSEDSSKAEESEEKKEPRSDRKRSHSKSRSRSRSAHSRSKSRSRSRSRSRSPRRRSPAENADDFTNEEDEPVVEENQIGLSWFDSDLHLLIDPVSFTSAKPMSDPVFDLVWSGARTNYGVKEGKVCYEVRISEETTLSSHFKDEAHVRGFRCGFSTTDTNLLIGEAKTSFALCDNGKKATNNEFVEFGKPFGLDDVIGCYLDLDSSPCNIQFTLNGENLGTAFEFDKSEVLGEGEEQKALFPHILTKGYHLQVNFADNENLLGNVVPPKRAKKPKKIETPVEQKEETAEQKTNGNEEESEKKDEAAAPADGDEEMKDADSEEKKEEENAEKPEESKPVEEENKTEEEKPETEETVEEEEESPKPRELVFLLPDYTLIGLVNEEKLISGPQRCESRKECEVYLLVGLPGSGKTHWTKNHIEANVEKRYNVIGPDSLIAKMGIDGTARKPHHLGKWDKVYDQCLSSLSSLEEIATKRRRNFILDQTNAFASAQRRKMKGFGDFKRIAVVCIPSYEDLKKRIELKSGEENSVEIRESSVDKLKANFTLPSTEFGWFEEVQFTDLKDDEAKAEVKKYNEKGKRAVDHSSRNKRPRNDYRRDDRRRYDDRRRDYRGYRDNRDRRGPPPNRFGGGGGGYSNNRSGGGGYRDDRHRNYDNRSGGANRYGNNNAGGGGGGSGSWVHGRRGYDDRYRSGGGGGSGGSRYDSYGGGGGSGGGGRNDYRERGYDRDRDRNGGGSRRNDSYRSGGQRDFRAGHRRIEDSRDGGFDRSSSKFNSTDDYDRSSSNSKSTNSSNNVANKWGAGNGQQQGGIWAGMGQQPQQQGYWGYDQTTGYNQQVQQPWGVNSADPRQQQQQQQQWMAYWQQGGNQHTAQQQQQYWSQYQAAAGYQNNDTTGSSK